MLPFHHKLLINKSEVMSGDKNENTSTEPDAKPAKFVLQDVPRKERNFPTLELNSTTLDTNTQPVLIIQSPKTPTLSRKLKAVSLDSDPPKQSQPLDLRDVFSMPNTPKKQLKHKYLTEFDENAQKMTLAPTFSSNLKRFASNTSISGSQTLKTLPEIMTLQDFTDDRTEPVRIKAKGLLERRGSNASLTIDLGSTTEKPVPTTRLNTAKSVSNLNLSAFGGNKCDCKTDKKLTHIREFDRRKSQTHLETCGNCTIYESVPSKSNVCKSKLQNTFRKCNCICNFKCGRKSLSNENLYVPPCNFCQTGASKGCNSSTKHCKGHRRACYPRQADLDASQMLSDDFKMHLQNVQYLQTAGSVLSISELKAFCEVQRVPKLHQEFWEVPLNLQEKCLVSGSQTRNRYRGVLPNEHSRVHLLEPQTYIHANFIKGPDYTKNAYIATQGPMSHTCEDFWEMVWITKCNGVVMLTQLVEKGRNKCELYFPLGNSGTANQKSFYVVRTTKIQDKFTFDAKNTKHYEEEIIRHEEINEVTHGKYRVVFLAKENLGDCIIRRLSLERTENGRKEIREIRHYWYANWQDHKMADPQQVLKIALHVLDFLDTAASDAASSEKQPSAETRTTITTTSSSSSTTKTSYHCYEKEVKVRKMSKNIKSRNARSETRLPTIRTSLETGNFRQYVDHLRKINPIKQSLDLEISSSSKKSDKNDDSPKCPLIVHCSAGIGRTGCFLAILNGIKQLKSNFNVDVLAIVCSLRLNRGGMVQTAEQYELIHRVLSLYTESM